MRVLVVFAAVLLCAGYSMALNSDNDMQLTYDPSTGAVTLTNPTGTDVQLTGYEIVSQGGNLIPTFNGLTGWNSLSDQGVSGWAEAGSVSGAFLAEVNLGGGTFLANNSVGIGTPVEIGTPVSDLTFNFSEPTSAEVFTGAIVVIPEPMSVAVLAAGAVALLRRRR